MPFLLVSAFALVLCALFARAVIRGLRGSRDEQARLARAVRVPGRVTGVEVVHGPRGRLFRFPVIAFRTLDGIEVEASPNGGQTNRTFRRGAAVTVCYDPQDPRRIWTDANRSLHGTSWLTTAVFAVVLVVFSVVALVTGGIGVLLHLR